MALRVRHLIAAGVIAINVGVAAYVSLMTWLLAVWFLDDSVAARMTDRDWQLGAAIRAVDALVAAALVAGGLFVLNRAASAVLPRRWPRRLALGSGAIVWLAGTAGAIEFLVTRPWF
jgi:hypothetical protein